MKAENPGFFILNENVSNHTAVNAQVQNRAQVVPVSQLFGKTKGFRGDLKAVDGILPGKAYSTWIKGRHLPLGMVVAAKKLHTYAHLPELQGGKHILFI